MRGGGRRKRGGEGGRGGGEVGRRGGYMMNHVINGYMMQNAPFLGTITTTPAPSLYSQGPEGRMYDCTLFALVGPNRDDNKVMLVWDRTGSPHGATSRVCGDPGDSNDAIISHSIFITDCIQCNPAQCFPIAARFTLYGIVPEHPR